MSKWKCDICGKEFENFHAQGFNHKIYCPLCFFKEENRRLKEKINTYENPEDLTLMFMYCDEKAKDKIKQLKEVIEEVREYTEELKPHWLGNDLVLKIIDDLLQILDKGTKENK